MSKVIKRDPRPRADDARNLQENKLAELEPKEINPSNFDANGGKGGAMELLHAPNSLV